jgi:tRNA-dihydrouridine synthase
MNISEFAHAIEEGGAAALTLHARHASARHAGQANWQVLARIKEERSIPVIGNGGINSADDAAKMFAETGVDGVMIGKAAIGNPWIFSEIWSRLHGLPGRPHSPAEHRAIIEEHLRLLINHMGKAPKTRRKTRLGAEQQAVLHFRGHLLGYIRGFANGIEVRRKLQDMRRMADVLAAVDGLPGAQSG